MSGHQVWRLDDAEVPSAGALLGLALVDDPIFVTVLPERADRLRLCPALFTANLRHACRFGGAWAAGERGVRVSAAAYWVPRPEPPLADDPGDRMGFTALAAEWGPVLERLGALEGAGLRLLASIPEPWHYLAGIGVHPDRQRQGLGAAVLSPVLADAAAARAPLALLTDHRATLPFYRRAQLELMGEATAAEGALTWWAFRTPGTATAKSATMPMPSETGPGML